MKRNPEIIRKTITLHYNWWEQVAEYRFDNHIPSLAEAVRRLIEAGLDVEKQRIGKKRLRNS